MWCHYKEIHLPPPPPPCGTPPTSHNMCLIIFRSLAQKSKLIVRWASHIDSKIRKEAFPK